MLLRPIEPVIPFNEYIQLLVKFVRFFGGEKKMKIFSYF
jgi:hypothetical protein